MVDDFQIGVNLKINQKKITRFYTLVEKIIQYQTDYRSGCFYSVLSIKSYQLLARNYGQTPPDEIYLKPYDTSSRG